ncbi:hypothetical protein ACIQNG_33815 [Streptomyces sp. NPDC091377]|uniref:hypothetical protein n=1 Tax=Streptomyces sp. NPDC091377 TaxID=3365995 RepID=UPI003824B49D
MTHDALPLPHQRRHSAPDVGPVLTEVTVTQTLRLAVADADLLARAGRHTAAQDPDTARTQGWHPGQHLAPATALRLLLADRDPSDLADNAPECGLCLTSSVTLAATPEGATLYEETS